MKIWHKILLFLASAGAIAAYFGKIFLVKKAVGHTDFPQDEKKRVEKLKADLKEEKKEVEKKEYSDKEIEDKFN